MQLLLGPLVGLLVGKSYHTRQKDGYSVPTNDPTNNHINWIWMSKKIGLYSNYPRSQPATYLKVKMTLGRVEK